MNSKTSRKQIKVGRERILCEHYSTIKLNQIKSVLFITRHIKTGKFLNVEWVQTALVEKLILPTESRH